MKAGSMILRNIGHILPVICVLLPLSTYSQPQKEPPPTHPPKSAELRWKDAKKVRNRDSKKSCGNGIDFMDGGSGTDTVEYSGKRSEFKITRNTDNSYTVVDLVPCRAETDIVINIERFAFADGTYTEEQLVPRKNEAEAAAEKIYGPLLRKLKELTGLQGPSMRQPAPIVVIPMSGATVSVLPKDCIPIYLIDGVDGDKVFFHIKKLVRGADAKSFVELHWQKANGKCSPEAYGKDKNRVYFVTSVLEGAVPSQFGILSEQFAFSGSSIYFRGELIPGADRNSFQVNKNGVWATDKSRFYCGKNTMDLATLKVFDETYVKDARTVCRKHELLDNADSATFQVK